MRRGAATALLLVAIALAFADSSIVVLALPELLERFHTEIAPVSWVITSYNLALALAALGILPVARRLDPRVAVRAGALVFAASSGGCALSTSLGMLVAFRAVQGIGGALLLTAALPLLHRNGAGRFALAATLGAAAGPAAGGALTQAFDWRAIFIAQAPVALLALAAPARVESEPASGKLTPPAASSLHRLGPRLAASLPPLPSASKLSQGGTPANLSLALLSGALVGALFLVVVLLVDAWRLSPLEAAAAVSALPLGALVAAPITMPGTVKAGLVLLAGGLAGLALIPDDALAWPVAALALCGLGTGLAAPSLTRATLAGRSGAAVSVGGRHLGLVVALVAVAPLLASDLDSGGMRAKLVGTARVLDAPVAAETKVPLAIDLVRAIDRAPRGKLPDFAPEFEKRGRTPELLALERRLDDTLRAIVTRSFRNAFLLCGGLALLALIPLTLRRRTA